MRKLRFSTLKILKAWLLPMVGLLVFVGLLTILYEVQQKNLDDLKQQLNFLEEYIKKLPTTKKTLELKEKLGLEKDLLLIKKDRVNAQNAVYGTLVQTLGGVFFFVTAYFTWRNVKATEEKQVTERFSKAVEQLQSSYWLFS